MVTIKNIRDRLTEVLDSQFNSIFEDLVAFIDEISTERYDDGYEEGLNEDSFDD